jgi:hypothetical protein
MKKKICGMFAGVCAVAMLVAVGIVPASAQDEPKEKPPMYSYVGNWNLPRGQWANWEKVNADDQKILEKAMADGTIVGYGDDVNLVHQPDGTTHDNWWSAMSMAGVLNVLDKFYKSGSTTSPVLASATKHWDGIYVSRYYNWHPGSFKGAYSRVAAYKLKADAPNDAVENLAKNLVVPMMEKLLADGSILEYEIDTEAIHTEDQGMFWVSFVATNAEGLDKFSAALRDANKMNPMRAALFQSMVDPAPHRDYLVSSNGIYK